MKMRYKSILAIVIMASVLLVSCESEVQIDDGEDSKIEEFSNEIETLNVKVEELTQSNLLLSEENKELNTELNNKNSDESQGFLHTALDIMQLIKDKNMAELSHYVGEKGIRFSPYFYVDTEDHPVFNAEEVAGFLQDSMVYKWGSYDGSGFPLELNFSDFYEEFIYDHDFINPHIIGNNTAIGSGNEFDNAGTVYPDANFVEFHFTGFDPEVSGIDWSSLRLVLEEDEGQWYLVGIIHGEWTI